MSGDLRAAVEGMPSIVSVQNVSFGGYHMIRQEAVLALIPEGAVLVTDPAAFVRQIVQDVDEADRSGDAMVDAEAIGNIVHENLRNLREGT